MSKVKDNTLQKTEAPKGEHPVDEKVEKTIDIRKVLTEKEAEELVYKEDHPEAPGSQASKEEKEKTEEPGKEKPEEEPKVGIPERYKGKSAEELVKLLDEKEKFIQGRSDEIGELREEAKETIKLKEKVAKIEEETMKESQQPSKLPQYFKQYRVKAYEQAYHDLSAADFSQTQKEEKEKVREQVRKEVIEEAKTHKEAGNIGLSDLETPQAGSAPEYDADRMEDDPEYRGKVIADMEERKRKGQI